MDPPIALTDLPVELLLLIAEHSVDDPMDRELHVVWAQKNLLFATCKRNLDAWARLNHAEPALRKAAFSRLLAQRDDERKKHVPGYGMIWGSVFEARAPDLFSARVYWCLGMARADRYVCRYDGRFAADLMEKAYKDARGVWAESDRDLDIELVERLVVAHPVVLERDRCSLTQHIIPKDTRLKANNRVLSTGQRCTHPYCWACRPRAARDYYGFDPCRTETVEMLCSEEYAEDMEDDERRFNEKQKKMEERRLANQAAQ